MTDEELIALVQETPAEQLSDEQLALLRQRMLVSAAVRDALADQLRLEQVMYAGLGRVRLDIDALMTRADRPRQRRRATTAAILALLFVTAVAAGVGWLVRSDKLNVPIVERVAPRLEPHSKPPIGNPPPTTPDQTAGNREPSPQPSSSPSETTSPAATNLTATTTAQVEPWTERLKLEPRPFEQACFDDLSPSTQTSAAQLRRWFKPLSGKLQVDQESKRWGLSLKGTFALRAPFAPGTVLRLAIE
ncbi:MAG TPA: hypothetical protein VG713_09955, partial [Pirellulales bacterium]|nr:hypothetical protein [Pirellulales bacterium]